MWFAEDQPESPSMGRNYLKVLGWRSSITGLQVAVTPAELMPGGEGDVAAQVSPSEDLCVAGTMAGISGCSDLPLNLAAPTVPQGKFLFPEMRWLKLDEPRWLHFLLEQLWESRDEKGLALRTHTCPTLPNMCPLQGSLI